MTSDPPIPPRIPDYELLKPIGRGSYGEVWLARSVTGVFRVIKVVRRDRFEDARPFLRELEGISRFQAAVSGRPRQLALLHVGRNDDAGYFYYVMEPADDAETGSAIDPERYVPLTLRELFRRRGRLPAAECVQIALELARGLAVLHGENLIHRDIKPSNIIFVQGVPKIADVGLVAASEASLTCVGTPGYLPPEGPGTIAADIFSLGKVLYEIATGLDRHEFPLVPTELTEGSDAAIHREINTIALRACHPNPRERHPSATAFARDLELIQAGRSVAFYEGLRKRFRTYALVGGATVALAAAVTVLMIWRADVLGQANEQARRALYRSDMAVAQLAKASGDLGRARAALRRQIPQPGESDLRGLEWSILEREVRGEGVPLDPMPPPASAVRSIATDPGGRWAAALFADNRVGIWDLSNRRLVRVLDNALVLGGFLPDGRLVIDEPIRALRLESPTNNAPTRIETGQRLGQLLNTGHVVLVSPKDDFIVTVLNVLTRETIVQFNLTQRWPHHTVASYAISQDLTWLFVSLFREEGAKRERLLAGISADQASNSWVRTLPVRIPWLRCSPDNSGFVANLGGPTPAIIKANAFTNQHALSGHTALVYDAAFSRDGALLATASADQTIRVWSAQSGKPLSVHYGLGRPATALDWSADRTSIIAGDDNGSLREFELPPSVPPQSLDGFYGDVHGDLIFSSSGKYVAATAATGGISILSADTLAPTRKIADLFQPILLSDDLAEMLAFRSDWTICKANPLTGTVVSTMQSLPTDFSVSSWAIAPNNRNLAVTGAKGQVALIELGSTLPLTIYELDTNSVWAITYSPNSKEVWFGTQKGAIKRLVISENPPSLVEQLTDSDIQALSLSADGRWLAVSLYNDSSIRILDRKRKKWLPPLVSHRRFVQALVFTEQCDRLVSGGSDGRVIVWSVPQFEEIAAFEIDPPRTITGDEGVAALRLASDRQTLACLTEDGRIQIWRGANKDQEK